MILTKPTSFMTKKFLSILLGHSMTNAYFYKTIESICCDECES